MRLEASAVIDRPVEEVFAFSTDIGNLALWAGPVTEATQTSEGSLGVGTTSTRVTQLLGRRFESDYEVTEYQPNSRYVAKTTSGPVPIVETLSFEGSDGGTKVTIAGELETTGFFKLAEPILARLTKRQVENDVATLKDLLEAQA
ncbi:MAG: SRPBCC family protein [Acidimicrobiia bacterium]